MVGGFVAVSAQASVQATPNGSVASAAASCTGAPNCTTTYTAHGEAHDRANQAQSWSTEGGYWTADGAGTCSGSGNSGCAVQAWAVAGPAGSGGAACVAGNCPNFHQDEGGASTFHKTSSSGQEIEAAAGKLGHKEKPPSVKDMGPEESGAQAGYVDGTGNFVPDGQEIPAGAKPGVQMKLAGQAPQPIQICAATGCSLGNRNGGPYAGYDPAAPSSRQFVTSNDVGAGDKRRDEATGQYGAAVSRDAAGNGAARVRGDGSITDGRTRQAVNYIKIAATITNTMRLTDPHGSPFYGELSTGLPDGAYSYTGAKITLPPNIKAGAPGLDTLRATGTGGTIMGRDGKGNSGAFDIQGFGTFTSAEGDVVIANGDGISPNTLAMQITTRDASGGNGSYAISGGQTGSITLFNSSYTIVQTKAAWTTRAINADPDAPARPYGTGTTVTLHGRDFSLAVATPDGAGAGGTIDCTGVCGLTRPAGQHQTPACAGPCQLHADLASGMGANPKGASSLSSLDGQKVTLIDPFGITGTCTGTSCNLVQRNGEGGGTLCRGALSCAITNGVGQGQQCTSTQPNCGSYLFNPITKGADAGRNSGRGCASTAGQACSGTGTTDLRWWTDNADGTLNVFTDRGARRTPTSLPIDEQLKVQNKERYQVDGKLPMLDKAAYDSLTPEQQQTYRASLHLSDEQTGLAVLALGTAASDTQYDERKVLEIKPGMEKTLAKIKTEVAARGWNGGNVAALVS